MSLQVIHSFVARGEASHGDVSCPVVVTGSYPVFSPDPAKCRVVPDMDGLVGGKGSPLSEQHTTNLRGKTEHGKEIWVPDFRVSSYSSFRARDQMRPEQVVWEGIADFFVEGDLKEFEALEGEIIYSIFTSPAPIADSGVSYVPSDDGTITIWKGGERKGIRWETGLGEAELIDTYTYHRDESVGLDPAMTRIKRCQITIKTASTGTVSLGAMLADLREKFDKALGLLSFLSRRRVVWYEAEVVFCPRDSLVQDFRRAVARRNQWLGYGSAQTSPPSSIDILVRHKALKNGLFQRLLKNYESSPNYGTIHQAMIHLLVSHERAYIENRYTSAYTALECLVYGLGREKTASFRRRSFPDRLGALLKEHNLDVIKLWPPNSDLSGELKSLARRRNVYFHEGKMEDHRVYLLDLNRIQNLIEIWILRLLDCPDEASNPSAIGHLVPITK